MADSDLISKYIFQAEGISAVKAQAAQLGGYLQAEGAKGGTAFSKSFSKTLSVENFGKMAGTVAAGAVAAAPLALAAGMAHATSVAANFEQSMANVASVTGGGAESMAALSAAAREAGSESVFSASEAGDAMYYLASAGMNTEQITTSLGSTLELAAAGGMGLADATEIVTSTLSQYGMQADEAGRVSNVMAAAAAATNTTIGQLGAGMGYVGPVAASLGMSLEETTAAMGLLANAGIKGERGGTALRGALSALLKPSKASAEAMAEMGLSVEDLDPATNSLTDIIKKLESGSMTAAQAVAIFGQEAGPSMLALVSQGSSALEDLEKNITGTNKAAEMAATQTETFQGSMKMLGSAVEEAEIALGTVFLPVLTEGVQKFTEGVKWATEFGSSVYQMGQNINSALEPLGGIGGIIDSLTISPGEVKEAWSYLTDEGGLSSDIRGALDAHATEGGWLNRYLSNYDEAKARDEAAKAGEMVGEGVAEGTGEGIKELDMSKMLSDTYVELEDDAKEGGTKIGNALGNATGEAFLESIKGYEATFAAGRSLLTGELLTPEAKRTRDEEEAYQANRAAQKPWPIYFKPEIVDVGTKSGGALDWDVIGDMISGGARGRAISGTVTDINSLSTALETAYGSAELAAAGIVYIMEQSDKGGRALELFRETQQEAYDQWKSDNADLISSIDPASEAFADFTRQLELDWEETEFQSWVETLPVDLLTIEDFSENTQRALYDIYEGMEIPDSVERDGGIGKRIVELSEIGDEGSQKILDNINTAWSAVLNGLESDSMDPDQFNVLDGYLDYLISEGADPEKIEEIKNILGDKLNPYEVWGSPQHAASYWSKYSDIIDAAGTELLSDLYSLEEELAKKGKPGWEEAWSIIMDPDSTTLAISYAIDALDLTESQFELVEKLRDTFGDIEAAEILEDLFSQEIPVSFTSMIKSGLTDFDEIFEDVGSQAVSAFNNGLSAEEIHSIADLYGELRDTDKARFAEMGGESASAWWTEAARLIDEYNETIALDPNADTTHLRERLDAFFGTYEGVVEVTADVTNLFGGKTASQLTPEYTLQQIIGNQELWDTYVVDFDKWREHTWQPALQDFIDDAYEASKYGYNDRKKLDAEYFDDLEASLEDHGNWYLEWQYQLIKALAAGMDEDVFFDLWDKYTNASEEAGKSVDALSDKYGNLAKYTAEAAEDCCEAMPEFGKAQEAASSDLFFNSFIGSTENYIKWLADTGEYQRRLEAGYVFPENIRLAVEAYMASMNCATEATETSTKSIEEWISVAGNVGSVEFPTFDEESIFGNPQSIRESADAMEEGLEIAERWTSPMVSGFDTDIESFNFESLIAPISIDTTANPPSEESIASALTPINEADATIIPGAELNQDDLTNIVTEIEATQADLPVGLEASRLWSDYATIVNSIQSSHIYIPVDIDVVANVPAIVSQVMAEIQARLYL